MLSFAKAFGDDFAMEPPEPSSPGIEEIVAGKLLLEKLYRALDALIPDGARVFRMRAHKYTEREIPPSWRRQDRCNARDPRKILSIGG